MMNSKVTFISKYEKSDVSIKEDFDASYFETIDGLVFDYSKGNKNVGKLLYTIANGAIEVRNYRDGSQKYFKFLENEYSAGTFIDEQMRIVNFKIFTSKILKDNKSIDICYDIISFNGIPGSVSCELKLEGFQ